jgi:GNAT superfamily N-acetyltransferase
MTSEMVLPDPWVDLRGGGDFEQKQRDALTRELVTELDSAHPLHGHAFTVVARSEADDDVLVALPSGGWAVVHLTWSGKTESPPWPATTFYSTFDELEHAVARLVGELLERAARAVPATVEDRLTGWWFRHTDNSTWWSGAVLAHGAPGEISWRIESAERFYAERNAVARFQVCAGCPDTLDRTLAERGYRLKAPIALLTAAPGRPIEAHTSPETLVRVDTALNPDWLAVLSATSGSGIDVEHETRLLPRVECAQAYVTVLAGGKPVGIGRAVADSGWTGVFNMATIAQMRRRGVARLILSAIARWADTQAAPRLYLQVERSNDAARSLYEAAGFRQLATYHYRVR